MTIGNSTAGNVFGSTCFCNTYPCTCYQRPIMAPAMPYSWPQPRQITEADLLRAWLDGFEKGRECDDVVKALRAWRERVGA